MWTLAKTGRIAEARTPVTPLGPELRFMMRRSDNSQGNEDLLWSMIFKPQNGGGAVLTQAAARMTDPSKQVIPHCIAQHLRAFREHRHRSVFGSLIRSLVLSPAGPYVRPWHDFHFAELLRGHAVAVFEA